MKTFALMLSLFLLTSCDVLRGVQADPKNPANLLALLTAVSQAKVTTAADIRAMRESAPAAFDKADKNHDGYLQPRELPIFLIDGKLEARAAFVQVLRNGSQALRARGDVESVELAGKVDAVLTDIDGWLVLIDLFEK